MLTKDQIKHVAKLANLPVTDQELEKYSNQLSKILDYIDQLNEVDTTNVEPTYNVSGKNTVLAQDQVKDSLTQNEAISNASVQKDGFFVTKGVFNNE